jgi:mono/diheme cytochrome c family protein
MRIARHRPIVFLLGSLLSLSLAACATDDPPSTAARESTGTAVASGPAGPSSDLADFTAYYEANCAVCHGSERTGVGRAPALTPEALDDDIEAYLDETDDRTHTNIWVQTGMDEDGRMALFEFLARPDS